jgi:hypothetical protein
MYTPVLKPKIANIRLQAGDDSIDAAVLYAQIVVDKAKLAANVRQALQTQAQVTLKELLARQPLQHGLAELIAYLQLASETPNTVIDEDVVEWITWQGSDPVPAMRRVQMSRVIFVR